jgi:hypothetical protein
MPPAAPSPDSEPADRLSPEEIEAYRAASEAFRDRSMFAGNPTHQAEQWLKADVVAVYDAMIANPGRAVSVGSAREKLVRHHAGQFSNADSGEREVVFSPEAARDLLNFYQSILAVGYRPYLALQITDYVIDFCTGLALGPHLTTNLDGFRPGLRLTSFRFTDPVSFHLTPTELVIDRILFATASLIPLPLRKAAREQTPPEIPKRLFH